MIARDQSEEASSDVLIHCRSDIVNNHYDWAWTNAHYSPKTDLESEYYVAKLTNAPIKYYSLAKTKE